MTDDRACVFVFRRRCRRGVLDMSRWGHRGTRGTHEDARVRVASRRRRRRVESRRCDDATIQIHRATTTGQRQTRANDRISEKTRLRFLDWKKVGRVWDEKVAFFKKKMKISILGGDLVWGVGRGGARRRRGDEETDGGGICPSICSRAFRARSVDGFFFCVCFARARTMASD